MNDEAGRAEPAFAAGDWIRWRVRGKPAFAKVVGLHRTLGGILYALFSTPHLVQHARDIEVFSADHMHHPDGSPSRVFDRAQFMHSETYLSDRGVKRCSENLSRKLDEELFLDLL